MTFRTKLGGSSIALLIASGLLLNCVGDDPSATTNTGDQDSGGTDAPSSGDSNTVGDSNILPTDAGIDAPSCVPPTSATPGALDQTFGSTFHAIMNGFSPFAFAIDATGQSYVAGQAQNCKTTAPPVDYDFAVVRFTKDGDLDTTFNPGGKPLCFSFGTGGEAAQAIAIDSDGKIVVGGLGGSTGAYVAGVVRFDSTGALDTTFNTTGMLSGVYGGTGYAIDSGHLLSINGIAFGPGNKIVLAGSDDNNGSNRTAGFLVRLTHGGSLDTGFAGGTGIYKDATNVGTFSHLIVGSVDGTVTAVGSYGSFALSGVGAVVERLTAAGALDSTFGTAGIYAPGPLTGAGQDIAHAIELTSSDELAVGGAFGTTNGYSGVPGIVMLDKTGKVDSTFGTAGVFAGPSSLTFDTLDLDVPLLPLCGGDFFYASRYNLADGGGPDIGLIHVLKNGTLDTSFGEGGVGLGMQPAIVNVVAIAQDPTSLKPLVMATNGSNQVGIFRFEL